MKKYEEQRAIPKELTFRIFNEESNPLEGAKIHAILHNLKTGAGAAADLSTDVHGLAVVKSPPYTTVREIDVDLADAENATGRRAYPIHLTQHDFIVHDATKQSLVLTLASKANPIPLKAKKQHIGHKRFNVTDDKNPDPRLPNLAVTEVGYDVELMEPVEPVGRGKRTDFIFHSQSKFKGYKDEWMKRKAEVRAARGIGPMEESQVIYGNWTHTVTFRFPNKGDGIVLSPHFWPYAALTVPHKAPDGGYVQELTLTEEQDQLPYQPDLTTFRKPIRNNGLFLRVRTQLDKDGNLISANYAKILYPAVSGFRIFYNPTPNDRNLEYDLKTNLRWKELHPNGEPIEILSPFDVGTN